MAGQRAKGPAEAARGRGGEALGPGHQNQEQDCRAGGQNGDRQGRGPPAPQFARRPGDQPAGQAAQGGPGDIAPGGERGVGLVDLLVEIRDGDRRDAAEGHSLQHPQAQQYREAGGQGDQQAQDGGRGDAPHHCPDAADPVGQEGPREHRQGQPHRRQGDGQRGLGGRDAKIRRQQREHRLGGVKLREGCDAGKGKPGEDPAVGRGALRMARPCGSVSCRISCKIGCSSAASLAAGRGPVPVGAEMRGMSLG